MREEEIESEIKTEKEKRLREERRERETEEKRKLCDRVPFSILNGQKIKRKELMRKGTHSVVSCCVCGVVSRK
jgi:hypothetical protein